MKKEYIKPIIEINEYQVEHGFTWSGTIEPYNPIIEKNCNCRGWDCSCSRRADCKGSGIDGCHSKFGLNNYDDELIM